ncbi:hypothetical protein [Streptococcus catagoni]|uniref:hypothetical protein n=1 Tax=Streptococcus catagoni TaxID=2654874 RepID=UPI00140C35F3|nr:hypothetical protein [Streptococcus catagoni]
MISLNSVGSGCYFGNIGSADGSGGGAAFIVIPANMANPHNAKLNSQDTIVIGQSGEDDNHLYVRK